MIFLVISLVMPPFSSNNVKAYSNHPNLFVSAENSLFDNHFFGAMIVEVIVTEDNRQLDEAIGEPHVTVDGKLLRMVQSSDGNWYAFFANTDKVKQVDQLVPASAKGQSVDFGVFCSGFTPSTVLGVDFSSTDGVAIPDSAGLSGTTQGSASFNSCSGNATTPTSQNNVIRNVPFLNMNPHVPVGQTGINPNVWPAIQLFTFSNNVHVEYNRGTGAQSVDLDYFDIPNITLNLDRPGYPAGSDVFATINDMQLNIDPTSADSWTFNVVSPEATFYQAFAETGTSASGSGLINLIQNLNTLGFRDNGHVSMDLSDVVNLKTNPIQDSSSVTANSITYNKLVTFVETGPNTGIFESDYSNISTIGILQNAPRSHSASIKYNLQGASIVSGTATASLTLGGGQGHFNPGQKETITLVDQVQNLNTGMIDELDVFRSSAVIPTLKIGNPITLSGASDVAFYPNSGSFSNPLSIPSIVFDANSVRLVIDTRSQSMPTFQKITLNLGITAQSLKDLFIDTSQSNSGGTNWINYDLRSFQKQLGITSFSGTSMTLYFGGLGNLPVQILTPGTIISGNGLAQLSDATVASIESKPSNLQVYLEINFNTSGNISNPQETQPIVIDLFSFGSKNSQKINNAIYRAELQETSSNSGTFSGTMEYAVVNQLNQFDPNLVKSLRTFGSNIKFLVNDQLVDDKGIKFSILSSEAGQETTVTSPSNLPTHTGIVTLDSPNYRIGSVVTISVYDPDLVTDADTIVSYTSVNDPNSPADDTVGDDSGNTLLEVWIKGFRFHQCTVNGVTYGGLASTGFALTETGPGTGIFKGSFKMPSQICNEDGTALISPVGGNVEAWYHDFTDEYGRSVVIESKVYQSASTTNNIPTNTPTVIPQPVKVLKYTQITDDDGRLVQNPLVGQMLNFQSMISNNDYQQSQTISYIIQVKDSENKVVFLQWLNDNLHASSIVTRGISWKPTTSGIYSVEIYLWDEMNSPIPLNEKQQYRIQVYP